MGVRSIMLRFARRALRAVGDLPLQPKIRAIEASGLFDQEYYLSVYPDVRHHVRGPIDHYLRYGYKEGRDASRFMSTKWYFEQYPDAERSGLDPLSHYIQAGKT